ncbi:hypothetical protein AMTRI_Chr13g124440 [Amborella trichopoda]
MSVPLEQFQPPPLAMNQDASASQSSNGSVGPVIIALAIIAILGVIAVMIGRLCGGGRFRGETYDFEGWVERKCASCIDGRIQTSSSINGGNTGTADSGSGSSVPLAIPIEIPTETKQTEQPSQNSAATPAS